MADRTPTEREPRTELQKYGRHLSDCDAIQPVKEPWREVRCTCTPEKWWGDHDTGCPRAEAFTAFMATWTAPPCSCGFLDAVEAAGAATETGGLPSVEEIGHALRLAWLDSHDAYGHALPPDLAEHLAARLSVHPDREDAPDGGGAT